MYSSFTGHNKLTKGMMEVVVVTGEPQRSWVQNGRVKSDGHIIITTDLSRYLIVLNSRLDGSKFRPPVWRLSTFGVVK